jgi:acyl-CoA thioesterase
VTEPVQVASQLHPYVADSATTAVGPGRYAVDVSQRWDIGNSSANGGYSMALLLQSLRQELPHPDLLVVSAHYLRPVRFGAAEVQTEVVRSGRRVSVGQAKLFANGAEAVRATATFTDLSTAEGPTRVAGVAPVLPPPQDCVPVAPHRSAEITTITERRMAPDSTGGVVDSTGLMQSEFWMRFSDGYDADTFGLATLIDLAPPVVMQAGTGRSTTIELTVGIRRRPAPGWLACRVSTRYLVNGFHEEDFDVFDSTGELAAQSRQVAIITG